MVLTDIRDKWNRRYADWVAEGAAPEPNPLAVRFREEVDGGIALDAACGLGPGIAALLDRVERCIGVDLSEAALAEARRRFGPDPRILWIQADVARMRWPAGAFSVVSAFGFTDWEFLRQVPRMIRPGGVFFYQGFSERQRTVKPSLDASWTSTPASISALFPGWHVLACEETTAPPFRVSYAGRKPADEPQEHA